MKQTQLKSTTKPIKPIADYLPRQKSTPLNSKSHYRLIN